MAPETQVQPKDAAQVEGEVVETTDSLPFEIRQREDLMRLFEEHPRFREEFDWETDPEGALKGFVEKYGEGPTEPEPETPAAEAGAEEEDFLAPEKGEEPAEPTKPAEPQQPADKGPEPETAKTLKEMKDRLDSALGEIEQLKKGDTKEGKKAVEEKIDNIDLSGLDSLSEDLDLITDEGQAQAKKIINQLAKGLQSVQKVANSYRDKLESLEGAQAPNEDIEQIKSDVNSLKSKEQHEVALSQEFKLIDQMVQQNRTVFGEQVRPIKEIETDYLKAINGMLHDVAGSKANITNERGQFTPEALRVLELANGTTEKAKRFQAKCKEQGIGLPEDLEALQTVYEIRKIRDELSQRDNAGNIIRPADYTRAAENYIGRNLAKFRSKDQSRARTAHERATQNRSRFAPESRPGAPAEKQDDLNNISADELQRLLKTEPKDLSAKDRQKRFEILVATGTPEKDARYAAGLDEEN